MIDFIGSLGVCPVCNAALEASTNTRPLATAVDSSGNGFSDFTVRTCAGCGVGFTSPASTARHRECARSQSGSSEIYLPVPARVQSWQALPTHVRPEATNFEA